MLDPIYLDPEALERLNTRIRLQHFNRDKASPEELHAMAKLRMEKHDALPAAWRALVHEFGPRRVKKLLPQFPTERNAAQAYYTLARIELDL